jgi:D-aminopeptidase
MTEIRETELMNRITGLVACSVALIASAGAGEKPRARDLGIASGILSPGELNTITDVQGIRVGHVSVGQAHSSTPA